MLICQYIKNKSNYSVISNTKSLNKKHFNLKLQITTNFSLTPTGTLNYNYFELKKAWNDFDLVELCINCVWIDHAF